MPFDLYNDVGQHWGQMRIAQYGGATMLQIKTDSDPSFGWQDFQIFNLIEGRLHYAVVGRRPSASGNTSST